MLPQHIEIKDALWNNLSFKSEGKNFEIPSEDKAEDKNTFKYTT